MAWNDVYSNDNGVHLLVTVGGRSYNFNKAVDLKVERKIGDTLSKFSLGIVDDGTNKFQQFEQVLTNKFVNIEISYGNSTQTKSNYTGFVVDYQSSFLGPSSKLTVSGYISRKHKGNENKLTSLYNYWINWAPVVGARNDTKKPWAMIYDGNFKFNNDMTDSMKTIKDGNVWEGAEDRADDLIDEALANQKARVDELKAIWEQTKIDEAYTDGWADSSNGPRYLVADGPGAFVVYKDGKATIYWGALEYQKYKQAMQIDIKDPYGKTITPPGFTYKEPYDANIKSVYEVKEGDRYIKYNNGDFALADKGGNSTKVDDAYKAYQSAQQAYTNLKNKLQNIKSNDTYSKNSGLLWDYGHVPWKYDIISKYEGNVKFDKFTHNGHSIARVVPDIFIPWDKTVPATLIDDPNDKRTDIKLKLSEFNKGVACDITIFGLQYHFSESVYNSGNPLGAYDLYLIDKHGNQRVFKAKDDYYIWVSDIPQLYNKFKENGWNYQDNDIEKNFNITGDNKKYNNKTNKDGSLQYYVYKKNKEYKQKDAIALGEDVHADYLDIKLSDDEIRQMKELNSKIKNGDCRLISSWTGSGLFAAEMGLNWWEFDPRWIYIPDEDKDAHKALEDFFLAKIKSKLSGDKLNYLQRGSISLVWGVKSYKNKKGNPSLDNALSVKNDGNNIVVSYWYWKLKEYGIATQNFTSNNKGNGGKSDNDSLKENWDIDVKAKNIDKIETSSASSTNMNPDYKNYTMTDLEENKDLGIAKMTKEQRVTQYLMAAYRSGEIMNYGQVYISDIVAQLCELEGWANPVIVATTSVDYRDPCLDMGGMSALEYISTTLCENAVEAGGLGRAGFTCYFDTSGRFHFEPVNAYRDKTVKTLQFGYNVANSSIISFTCRSKGKELMLETETDLSCYNMLTGEDVAASISRQDLKMSLTERKLYNAVYGKDTNGDGLINNDDDITETVWFNLPMFNYYGYQQDKNDYETFTKNVAAGNTIEWGTNLVRKYYKSSTTDSTKAALTALNDLTQLKNSPLKAEMTIIGDNEITPGTYIYVLNHVKNGFHYTSGYYYIRQVVDTVTTGNGFTQSLDMRRYSDNVVNMTTNIKGQMIANSAYSSRLEEAIAELGKGGDAFDEYYNKYFND